MLNEIFIFIFIKSSSLESKSKFNTGIFTVYLSCVHFKQKQVQDDCK